MNTFDCPLSLNISGNEFEQFRMSNASDNQLFFNLESGQIYGVNVRMDSQKCFNISKEWKHEETYSFNATSEHVSIFWGGHFFLIKERFNIFCTHKTKVTKQK